MNECLVSLRETFGNEALSEICNCVYNYFAELHRACTPVNNESREMRPKSVVIPNNIDAVSKMIEEDQHASYSEMEAYLVMSQITTYLILHEYLSAKKVCSRWTPHNLTEAQKEARANWCEEVKKIHIGNCKIGIQHCYK